jgi:hypothetical protein
VGRLDLYVRRTKDLLTLTVEHRAAAARDPLTLRLIVNDRVAHLALAATPDHNDAPEPDLAQRVLKAVRDGTRPLDRNDLRDALRVRNERLGVVLTALRDAGKIVRVDGGWTVPVPPP